MILQRFFKPKENNIPANNIREKDGQPVNLAESAQQTDGSFPINEHDNVSVGTVAKVAAIVVAPTVAYIAGLRASNKDLKKDNVRLSQEKEEETRLKEEALQQKESAESKLAQVEKSKAESIFDKLVKMSEENKASGIVSCAKTATTQMSGEDIRTAAFINIIDGYIDAAKKSSSNLAGRDILRKGLDLLSGNAITESDKALIDFGIKLGKDKTYDYHADAYNARMAVMETLKNRSQNGVGPDVSVAAIESVKKSSSDLDSRTILLAASETIRDTTAIDSIENALSDYVVKLGKGETYSYHSNCVNARLVAMNMIKDMVQGPVGVVISKAGIDAVKVSSSNSDSRIITRKALDIIQERSTDKNTKALATLGINVAADATYNYQSNAINARLVILNMIKDQAEGSVGYILSKAGIDSVNICNSPGDSKIILRRTFRTIKDNVDATPEQRNIAIQSLDMMDSGCPVEALVANLEIIKQMPGQ
jgi:hypothetical protein